MYRKSIFRIFAVAAAIALLCNTAIAQDTLRNKKNGGYLFKAVKNSEATAVRNQCQTATCWSFSSLSFLESELIRTGKGFHNLSEMWIVRNAYFEKALMYLRMDGEHRLDEGGEFHDIPLMIKKYGIVPEEVYRGLTYKNDPGDTVHYHAEALAVIKAMMDKVKEQSAQGKLSQTAWKNALNGVLDAYFGVRPEKFSYRGKEYTPQSFAASLGLNMDDYVYLTSFTHHQPYTSFVIEVPDNWSMQTAWNLPLNEMLSELEGAVKKGYTVAWAADVSEKGFSFRDGLAIVPVNDTLIKQKGKDPKFFNEAGAQRSGSAFDQPYPEKAISPELRQKAFDEKSTTDDHGMHFTGLYTDQNGTKYYRVKNSWGIENYLKGYFFASDTYVRYKTIALMLHKDALSPEMKAKLGIK